MNDCIFCNIVEGAIPCTRIYEDDAVLAFMDIGPLVRGHALVIPKPHFDSLSTIPEDMLAHVMAVVRRVAKAQWAGLGADGVNVHQANGAAAGQVVPHLHFHVIPRFSGDGHHWNWRAHPYADPSEAAALAERIKSAMDT